MSKIFLSFLFLFISFYGFSKEFFGNDTQVILLDSKRFEEEVINSKDIWLVLFFAPWCGHCKAFSPEFELAAGALKGIFKLGAVNADKEEELANEYVISGYPTIKFFGIHKDNPIEYESERNAQAIIDFMFEKAKKIVDARAGINDKMRKKKKIEKNTQPQIENDVYILNENNFDETIFKGKYSEYMWMVAFYAPWCGHCKQLLPEWNLAATQLKGKIYFAKVDATENEDLAKKYDVNGYPTIKIFSPGKDKKVEKYNGSRKSGEIVRNAHNRLVQFQKEKKSEEL